MLSLFSLVIRRYFLFILLTLNFSVCLSQDSTELPRGRTNGKFAITCYPSIKYLPGYLQQAIDSINGSPLLLSDMGERRPGKNNILQKPLREFKRLDKEYRYDAWLLTYVHRDGKYHIHFFVFTMKDGRVYKITSGISDYDIDSISTLERKKREKSIRFINLKSKNKQHKF